MNPYADEAIGRSSSGEVDFRDHAIRDADGESKA
jgi:hypothetical protein